MNTTDFREIELDLVDLFCDKELAAVDIGTTGSGPYTELMLPSSRMVFCFEPHPRSAERMRERYGRQVILKEAAVSDYVGTATLNVPLRDDGQTERHGWSSIEKDFPENQNGIVQYEVKVTTLDEENLPNISFIKIDVEGAEIEVLKGGTDTIRKSRPIVLLEMDELHRSGTLKVNTLFFEKKDYEGYYIEHKTLHPIREFIESGRENTMDINEKNIFNFIFIPKEKTDVLRSIEIRLKKLKRP